MQPGYSQGNPADADVDDCKRGTPDVFGVPSRDDGVDSSGVVWFVLYPPASELWWLWRLTIVSVEDVVPIEDIDGMNGGGRLF